MVYSFPVEDRDYPASYAGGIILDFHVLLDPRRPVSDKIDKRRNKWDAGLTHHPEFSLRVREPAAMANRQPIAASRR
jgi:hypothetical protein